MVCREERDRMQSKGIDNVIEELIRDGEGGDDRRTMIGCDTRDCCASLLLTMTSALVGRGFQLAEAKRVRGKSERQRDRRQTEKTTSVETTTDHLQTT